MSRWVALFLLIWVAACAPSTPESTGIVDSRSEETTVDSQTAADTLAALKSNVEALTKEVAALKEASLQHQASLVNHADLAGSMAADIVLVNIELADQATGHASLADRVMALETTLATLSPAPSTGETQLWLYDKNGVRRHAVLSLTDRRALVQLTANLQAEYPLYTEEFFQPPLAHGEERFSSMLFGFEAAWISSGFVYFLPKGGPVVDGPANTHYIDAAWSEPGRIYKRVSVGSGSTEYYAVTDAAPAVTLNPGILSVMGATLNSGTLSDQLIDWTFLSSSKTYFAAQNFDNMLFQYAAPLTVGP